MGKVCGIYCIENLKNNKKYIGQSVNINKRLSNHKYQLKKKCHKNTHLQNAWNTYGSENFKFYVVEECSEELLDNKETFYIAKFDCMNPDYGYNFESGGNKNKHLSEKTKNKISISQAGKHHTEETKLKIKNGNLGKHLSDDIKKYLSEIKMGTHMSEESRKKLSESRIGKFVGENNPMYGKKQSNETREKMSRSHGGKPIYCLELNEIFWGVSDAVKTYGFDRVGIIRCLKGERQSAGKHPTTGQKLTWKYIDNSNNT